MLKQEKMAKNEGTHGASHSPLTKSGQLTSYYSELDVIIVKNNGKLMYINKYSKLHKTTHFNRLH